MSSMSPTGRADRPVERVDFVNLRPEVVPDAPAPQPDNHALAAAGALPLGDTLIACSRSLVEETLRNPGVFSSADLVDQGNIRPLIPLAIDPPDHLRYRRLLDPMFAPPADRPPRGRHHHAGATTSSTASSNAGACDFTAEFAELFPSSVFLGMMGLDWEELDTLVALRDGILRPGTAESTPEERTRIQKDTAQRVYALLRRGAGRAGGRASRRHPVAAQHGRGRRRTAHPRGDARHLLRAAHRRARHRHRLADLLLGVPRPAPRSPAPARRAPRGDPDRGRGAAPLGDPGARRRPVGPRGPRRR